ncbi:MAG: GyrI-like domain-containing protein [Bacteroidota bacterium]
MKTKIHHFVLGAFVCGSFLATSCGGGDKAKETKEKAPEKDTVDTVAKVEEPKLYQGYQVNEKDFPATVYVSTKKEKMGFDKLEAFFGKHFPAIYELSGKAGHSPAGPTVAVYYVWDTIAKTTELQAAVPVVANGEIKIKGYEKLEIPASKCLHIEYYGAYEKIGPAHMAMDEYMAEKGLTQKMVLEEYVTDPGAEPDTSKWLTNVFYIIE